MATIIVCDICNSRENVSVRSYAIDKQADLAGGRAETIEKHFDLCQSCELKILINFVKQILTMSSNPLELNKELINNIHNLINSHSSRKQ